MTAPTPDAPRPATDYDLDRYLPGVMSNGAFDSAGCRWCHRPTLNMFTGHDGYCPIPALFAIHDRLRAAEADRDMYKIQYDAYMAEDNPSAERNRIMADRDEARAMAARMADALGRAADEYDYCWACDCHPSSGHGKNCPITSAAALREAGIK